MENFNNTLVATESYSLNTPLMKQYIEIKNQYPNEILFFRMGDFYEMFLDDAIYASRVMNIALTKRGDGVPMCGIPYHSWSKHVYKILSSGKNIAICEQLEDPKNITGKIVKRGVVRVITPGSIFEEELLQEKQQNRIASIVQFNDQEYLFIIADMSTGEIIIDKSIIEDFNNHFLCYNISEIIIENTFSEDFFKNFNNIPYQTRSYQLTNTTLNSFLETAFKTKNINTLELTSYEQKSLFHLLAYANEIAPYANLEWQFPDKKYLKNNMFLDEAALKTLEILRNQDGNIQGSLLSILDCTQTASGYRLLHTMLSAPLMDSITLNLYYDTVDFFMNQNSLRKYLRNTLKEVKDIHRLLNHLRNNPQVYHIGGIYYTLLVIKNIKQELIKYKENLPDILQKGWLALDLPNDLIAFFEEILYLDDLPNLLDERRFVKKGYSTELDGYFKLSESAQEILIEFENQEKQKYDISTLKIRYNKIIGYYIEISKGLLHKVPSHYIRRQTLTTGERYTIEELSDLENKIINAKELVVTLQKKIFKEIIDKIFLNTNILNLWIKEISLIDVLLSFAEVAELNNYTRPKIIETGELKLTASRHPVVENLFKAELFTSNNVYLNTNNKHLAILTGPNMAGKSTYIRQVGLIQIMAQIGSFVPAKTAELTIVDRVFTRIGAYDRLFKGESTFFVEMLECSHIFRHYTPKSLILLDEVGRGTSTYDGMSIAKAMIDYMNQNTQLKPKVLFATHFAELADMIDEHKGIFGLTVSIAEQDNKIIFLRKIIEGIASKSYGIYVAELAGLPETIINSAKVYLSDLEKKTKIASSSKIENVPKGNKIENVISILKDEKIENQPSMF